jgi:adenosylmethionine-8-amino-7-oxononanoate aminotransferase
MKDPASKDDLLALDAAHVWHPYSAMCSDLPVYPVESAAGVCLELADGRRLIDGMSSWWCAIHGYNHPRLNRAVENQLRRMAHVMFGGLTHAPAARLAEKLVDISPTGLQSVFLCDSGSVSVEVAMKMAVQFWNARGRPKKQHFASLRNGYHGDTLGAMSVCDPVTGMHTLFNSMLIAQHFVERPVSRFGQSLEESDAEALTSVLERHHEEIAALILEPVVQGAGGMYFYAPQYLERAREICDRYEVLLIADEIATGFGRSGELFACNHAAITPDIMCIGKALTGGYLSLAATLATTRISETIDSGNPGLFMHGPTFMGNPLACAVALESIELLLESDWQARIARLEKRLEEWLAPCASMEQVAELRCLGAIGVIEMKQPVDMAGITRQFVDAGVWVRPFGRLVYLMPAYVITDDELQRLCAAVVDIVARQ